MLIKIIGAAILIASSGLYGIYNSKKIEMSLEQAKEARLGLNALKQEIYINEMTIDRALENASELLNTEVKALFTKSAEGVACKKGTSLQEYFMSAMEDKSILLDNECKNILARWVSNAGGGDRKTEVDNLTYTLSQLDLFIEKEEETCGKLVKLHKSCGFLIGAFVVAVLL